MLELRNCSAYFEDVYWCRAEVMDGEVTWSTAAYIPGAGRYSYSDDCRGEVTD